MAKVCSDNIVLIDDEKLILGTDGDHEVFWDSTSDQLVGIAKELGDLEDVVISSPTNNQALVYNTASQQWENKDQSGGITAVVEDTTPQLGGDLDMNQKNIQYTVPTDDMTSSGIIISATVDSNASGFGAALYMASDGNFDEADADSASTMPCRALALESGTGTKKIILQGFIRDNTWNWTVGGDLYVSTTTGALTQTAPTGNGDQVQKVGFAWTADIVYFSPGDYTIVEVQD